MSAPDLLLCGAVAFQLAATLERYEHDVAQLVAGPLDPEVYHRVSALVDQMRTQAAALPPLSVAWVEVLIRHFELTHGLWRRQHQGAADIQQLHAQLRRATGQLARECSQLLPAA